MLAGVFKALFRRHAVALFVLAEAAAVRERVLPPQQRHAPQPAQHQLRVRYLRPDPACTTGVSVCEHAREREQHERTFDGGWLAARDLACRI